MECRALKRLKEEGRQEGRQEGQRERDINLIRDWLQEGYSVEMIAKLLKKPEEFVKKIQEES